MEQLLWGNIAGREQCYTHKKISSAPVESPHKNCFVLAQIPHKNCSVPAKLPYETVPSRPNYLINISLDYPFKTSGHKPLTYYHSKTGKHYKGLRDLHFVIEIRIGTMAGAKNCKDQGPEWWPPWNGTGVRTRSRTQCCWELEPGQRPGPGLGLKPGQRLRPWLLVIAMTNSV